MTYTVGKKPGSGVIVSAPNAEIACRAVCNFFIINDFCVTDSAGNVERFHRELDADGNMRKLEKVRDAE